MRQNQCTAGKARPVVGQLYCTNCTVQILWLSVITWCRRREEKSTNGQIKPWHQGLELWHIWFTRQFVWTTTYFALVESDLKYSYSVKLTLFQIVLSKSTNSNKWDMFFRDLVVWGSYVCQLEQWTRLVYSLTFFSPDRCWTLHLIWGHCSVKY